MNTLKLTLTALALVLLTSTAHAAPKTYQVTGPILAITDTMITVQKGKEKWEIEKSAATKVTGELKVGAKITIFYRMVAESVESKAAAEPAKAAAPAKK